MILTVADRILFTGIFTLQPTRFEVIPHQDIVKKTEFSQEELEKLNIELVNLNGGVSYKWNKEEEKELDVNFTSLELKWINKNIEALPTDKTYSYQEYKLIEKFMPSFFQIDDNTITEEIN